MPQASEHGLFSLLPQRRPPWREFVLSTGVQGLVVLFAVWILMLRPQVLIPTSDYHYVELVSTPPPVNHVPAPVRASQPAPVVAEVKLPLPETLRVAPPVVKPKVQPETPPAPPKIEIASKVVPLQPVTPVIPRQLVKTNVFSTGSSETPTTAKAPAQVQTGGFGDPKGVPERSNEREPVNIARLGSFDAPSGPGAGNGTAGAKGARGVVASAGFGNGVATGDANSANPSRGAVREGGFGDAESVAPTRSKPAETVAKMVPAEILAKPTPVYTDEARKLRIEGEVLLEVVFESSGKLRVVRVVRGLGHGLDEAAIRAAEQIHFKPAMRDGQPADSGGVLHVVFQLA